MSVARPKDLTVGLLGLEVPTNSPTIEWNDGHKTILPALYDSNNVNVCHTVDIPIIKYLAQCPESTPHSKHVLHISNTDFPTSDALDPISDALSQNKPVVIRGIGNHHVGQELTADFLDQYYAISPHRAVWVHDVKARAVDHMNPTKPAILKDFFKAMKDPETIQCVLDFPLAQASLPDALKNLDHGLTYGWNGTTYDVPITSKVHPENFSVKGWALLHHAGFLTYPHHDAEGALTWAKMEVGVKFWVVFRPKDRHDDRQHLRDMAMNLANMTENGPWIRQNCDAEVVTLYPGDIIIMPPAQVHAVYTPVASLATGGHFYHYGCMHLTEISRYLDVSSGDCLTNQILHNALETLRRMMIAMPRLSPRIRLFKRSILALCIMVKNGKQYRAKGGPQSAVADTETATPSLDIAIAIASHLGVTKRKPAHTLLYNGDQLDRGKLIEREKLDKAIEKFTAL
ncbi:hypothetical protein DEU56DRAFT_913013 [Suillus clintonianus]|uniref:uncharacterized protein n=1 Tax=Suillus clintonianus TaxID=1904413 RepID=UPI001B86EC8F|nr:uncharacterized protein DEU56DRAFT_913013 [Suillus clintonianus]KAG2136434.1 hypothetical protein DEU56DRAFT_913013 [Suillus clintonianus]